MPYAKEAEADAKREIRDSRRVREKGRATK
jgi:hypothetical protein